jgi:2',3'-cyclic-nucleotide 2'-phosphodiesterase (5'-nucleotidase family)
MKFARLLSGVVLLFLIACNKAFVPAKAEYEVNRITAQLPVDSSMLRVTQVYRDSINKSMNEVLGILQGSLDKKQPSGSLNNFMGDALLQMAKEKINAKANIALVNYGGIRLNQLPAGNITRGKVFELMPFDNYLIVQEMKGDVLQSLLNLAAEKGGWAIAGAKFQIQNKKAINVLIDGQPINASATYYVANSDYIANGGDNANMLKSIPQQNKGYLIRDAIIDYVKAVKTILVNDEKRITNAE